VRSKKIILRQAQLEIAKRFGITPEMYARVAREMEDEDGVKKRRKRRHKRNNKTHNITKG
jgi:hypothetical protein